MLRFFSAPLALSAVFACSHRAALVDSAATPPTSGVYDVRAEIKYTTNAPTGAATSLRFVLKFAADGEAVTGFAGVVRDARISAAAPPPTATSLIRGRRHPSGIVFEPFALYPALPLDACASLGEVQVESLAISADPQGRISGSIKGVASYRKGSAVSKHTFDGVVGGEPDRNPPNVVQPPNGTMHVLDPLRLDFSEPVVAPLGTIADVFVKAGSLLINFNLRSNQPNDPADAVYTASTWAGFGAPPFPFDAPITVSFGAAVSDLANNPAVAPALTLRTIAEPAISTNLGFETGDLSGFLEDNKSSCVEVVQAVGNVVAPEGKWMLYYSASCLATASPRVTCRLPVPAGATKLVFSIDRLANSPNPTVAVDLSIVGAVTSNRVFVNLESELPQTPLPLSGAIAFPTYHSGFKEVSLDVAPLHDGSPTMVLMIGRIVSAPMCAKNTDDIGAVVLDNIRFK